MCDDLGCEGDDKGRSQAIGPWVERGSYIRSLESTLNSMDAAELKA